MRVRRQYTELLLHHPHNDETRSSPTADVEHYMINRAVAHFGPKQAELDWAQHLLVHQITSLWKNHDISLSHALFPLVMLSVW